jgi:penicillin V acylase-like amidase (Ntn superfamily)
MMRLLVSTAIYGLLLIYPLAGPSRACTSFCLDTPQGPVFAVNFDFFFPGDGIVFVNHRGVAKEGYLRSTTGQTAKWVSEYGSVTFNVPGRELPREGINETGLVVSTMALKDSKLPKPDERPPLDSASWVQYVLDTCSSVQEAIHVDSLVRLQDEKPNHFLVADQDGHCAVIEYLDGRLVFYTGESLPVKALTNMPYARALAALERGGARWWESNPEQSAERFAGAAARIENYNANRDICPASHALETLINVVAAADTKWNIVYDIAKREIRFRSVASPTVKRLSLNAFDFSCGAPLMMLDVNAALEGNVAQSFTPYDHDANLKAFRTFCHRWEIEVSTERVVELMRFFESFECAR